MILRSEALGPEGRALIWDWYPYKGGLSREKMATHSSILAWKISRTEETGWLQSVGSQSHTTENVLTQK